MESIIVSNHAVAFNLRRAASEGLLSSLTANKLNELALKYFGIYENGELVGYQCPYSGKKITNPKKIVLEHIIPISRGGGTVLFNCIPTSVEVNKSNEKGTKHLISWWKHPDCKYWNKNAPARLEKIINYLIEGYEIIINEENLENNFIESYSEDNYDNDIDNSDADLSTTQEDEQKRNKNESIITYYGLMNDLINALSEYTDVSLYQEKLQNLIKGNVFEKIKRQTLIQKYLKDIIKNKLEIEDRSELTYTLNINISKLSKSLEKYSDNEIYSILEKRIDNLEYILNNNNLSLDSFFSDNNSLIYLYKELNDLTAADITNLVENINMSVADKFNAMIEFVISNGGKLPSAKSNNNYESLLGRFKSSIQTIQKLKRFSTSLCKKQLEYLHNSEYSSLKEIYKEILNKAIEHDVKIEYVDESMKERIIEFNRKNKSLSINEQISLEQEYKDVIIIKSQFNEFVNFVINHNGTLPNTHSQEDCEKKLGNFRMSIKTIQDKRFITKLNKKQLEYLHNSEYSSLKEIYKEILNKAIEHDVKIEYVDESMKERIIEFNRKNKSLSINEQISLEQEYKDVIIIKSQFNEFVNFVINHNGALPNTKSENKKEKKLGDFIQKIKKNRLVLNFSQLEYLHNSEYSSLIEIYKVILNRAIEHDVKIEYVDESMKERIIEFNRKNKSLSINEQISLEQEYKDVIIIKSQFNEFVNFVINHNGELPRSKCREIDEKKLGNYRHGIISTRNNNSFHTSLSREQLMYLHNSEYSSLKEIYKEILNKAIENNIKIEYVDESMKERIAEFNRKNKNLSINEQIRLEKEYKDVIIIKSQFNKFAEYVINNKGLLPNKSSKYELEAKLGAFRTNIQRIDKSISNFAISLTKSQLQYLHDSEYESLRKIYDTIMEKAISINYEPYTEINNEIELERRKVA